MVEGTQVDMEIERGEELVEVTFWMDGGTPIETVLSKDRFAHLEALTQTDDELAELVAREFLSKEPDPEELVIECHVCRYEWEYRGHGEMATCPNCGYKTGANSYP